MKVLLAREREWNAAQWEEKFTLKCLAADFSYVHIYRPFEDHFRSDLDQKSRVFIYIYIFSSIENFFSKIALLFEEGENRAFRTFARRSEKIRVRSRYGQDPGETVFRNRRKLSIDPPFESVDSHACVSQCSFHPRDDCLSASLRLLV